MNSGDCCLPPVYIVCSHTSLTCQQGFCNTEHAPVPTQVPYLGHLNRCCSTLTSCWQSSAGDGTAEGCMEVTRQYTITCSTQANWLAVVRFAWLGRRLC